MCQIPLKFYEFNDPNNQTTIKMTTIQTPAINILEPVLADNQVTKVEFAKSDGTWVEPTHIYQRGKLYRKFGYPYVMLFNYASTTFCLENTAIGSRFGHAGTQGDPGEPAYFLDIASTSGKMGIRIWSGKNIVFQWLNYSESHISSNSYASFTLTESTTLITEYLRKVLPINFNPFY